LQSTGLPVGGGWAAGRSIRPETAYRNTQKPYSVVGIASSSSGTYVRSLALLEKLPIVQPLKKFSAFLWNPKVHHSAHNSPPLIPILSQIDPVHTISSHLSKMGRAISQAVSRRLYPPRRPGFKPGSGHVRFCDGQKWRWGRFSPRRTSVSSANLHSICFSTIIFTITRGWHNRPGVAAVPIVS
jgi:hypothetical protein